MRVLPAILLPLLVAAAGCDDDGRSASPGGKPFFLPTGEPTNTSAPVLEADASGRLHMLYPAYARGGAFYATCVGACSRPEDVAVVPLPTEGTVARAMLAVTPDGRPRALLATMLRWYWASCEEACSDGSHWRVTPIAEHGGVREVTGEALALDADGRPRFLSHTYRAYLGVGQKPYRTDLVRCDDDCHDPARWQASPISDQNWQGTHLRVDEKGRFHVATVASDWPGAGPVRNRAAWLTCEAACDQPDAWHGTGLVEAYENTLEAVAIEPSVALAVTKAGAPRVLTLARDASGGKRLLYFACDDGCTDPDRWVGITLSEQPKLGAGIDLALDAADHPRYVYTLDYSIVLGKCDAAHCESDENGWSLTRVEAGSELPKDQIYLYPNCTVSAWFLHGPSLALGKDGRPRVGYQARDISGGLTKPDPTKPACVAGTDMTWSRLAQP